MKQCGLCTAGCLPFPGVWLEPRLGKVTPEMPGESHALPPALGGHGGNGSLVSLPEAGRGGRSVRRTGGHRHVPNPERKLLGEQRMSRISRVGCVRSGLGENKAQGSPALLPLPPGFLLARDGDRWLPGEGSVRAGAGPQLPAWPSEKLEGSACLSFPRLRCAVCSRMVPRCWPASGGLGGLGCSVLGLLCSRDAPEVLAWRMVPVGEGGGSHSHVKASFPQYLNRQVSHMQMGLMHPQQP